MHRISNGSPGATVWLPVINSITGGAASEKKGLGLVDTYIFYVDFFSISASFFEKFLYIICCLQKNDCMFIQMLDWS